MASDLKDDGKEYRPLRRSGPSVPTRDFRRLNPNEGEPFYSDAQDMIERSEGRPIPAWPWPKPHKT